MERPNASMYPMSMYELNTLYQNFDILRDLNEYIDYLEEQNNSLQNEIVKFNYALNESLNESLKINDNLCLALFYSSVMCPKTKHLRDEKLCNNCKSNCYEEWEKWGINGFDKEQQQISLDRKTVEWLLKMNGIYNEVKEEFIRRNNK